MIVAGLTGSIGMGKSTVANYLRDLGIPVLDADKIVHELYEGEAVPFIEEAFPASVREGKVDRATLSRMALGSEKELRRLEAIIHPLVRAAEWQFLQAEQLKGVDLAVLEIPLLFETASHTFFDAIIVVSASAEAQRDRVLRRPGMTLEKLEAVLNRQWPDAIKCEKADYVVDTGGVLADTFRQIDAVMSDIIKRQSFAYRRWADLYQDVTQNTIGTDAQGAGSRYGNNGVGPQG